MPVMYQVVGFVWGDGRHSMSRQVGGRQDASDNSLDTLAITHQGRLRKHGQDVVGW